MISDALLGSRVPQPSLRGRLEERLCWTLPALRQWWKVTTSSEYLASSERRLVFKPMALLLLFCGTYFWSGFRFSSVYFVCTNIVARLCLVAIPRRSLLLDILWSVWNFLDLQQTDYFPAAPLVTLLLISWTHLAGLHSLAALPPVCAIGQRETVQA